MPLWRFECSRSLESPSACDRQRSCGVHLGWYLVHTERSSELGRAAVDVVVLGSVSAIFYYLCFEYSIIPRSIPLLQYTRACYNLSKLARPSALYRQIPVLNSTAK